MNKFSSIILVVLIASLFPKTESIVVPQGQCYDITREDIEQSIKVIDRKRTLVSKLCDKHQQAICFIHAYYFGIEAIHPDAFIQCTNLCWLFLNNNKLTSLQSGTFRFNKKLQFLDLSHNKLNNMPLEVFRGLDNLEELHLSENPRLRTIEPVLQGYLKYLDVLSIAQIGLPASALHPKEVKEKLPNLSQIAINHNPFKCSELEAFTKQFQKLKVVVNDYPIGDHGDRCIKD